MENAKEILRIWDTVCVLPDFIPPGAGNVEDTCWSWRDSPNPERDLGHSSCMFSSSWKIAASHGLWVLHLDLTVGGGLVFQNVYRETEIPKVKELVCSGSRTLRPALTIPVKRLQKLPGLACRLSPGEGWTLPESCGQKD